MLTTDKHSSLLFRRFHVLQLQFLGRYDNQHNDARHNAIHHYDMKLSIQTLELLTLSIITLELMTLSIQALNILTLSITTLYILTLSIPTLDILILSITTFNIMILTIQILCISTLSITGPYYTQCDSTQQCDTKQYHI